MHCSVSASAVNSHYKKKHSIGLVYDDVSTPKLRLRDQSYTYYDDVLHGLHASFLELVSVSALKSHITTLCIVMLAKKLSQAKFVRPYTIHQFGDQQNTFKKNWEKESR